VPGIGVAIIAGTVVFVGLSQVFDIGGKRKKEKARKEVVRKAQFVIRNLQQMIDTLAEQMRELQKAAADAEANREAIRMLNERMAALKQLIAQRELLVGVP
jgi:uncharacterized protein YlxW (UPF0749 family)